jgi:hypothetical protein
MNNVVPVMVDDKVLIPHYIDKDEFWSEIFGSSWEMAEHWRKVKFLSGDWDKAGEVMVVCENPYEDGNITKVLRVEDLASAYAFALEKGYHHCGSTINIEDMDMCAGDIVMQCAVYGDVIYG